MQITIAQLGEFQSQRLERYVPCVQQQFMSHNITLFDNSTYPVRERERERERGREGERERERERESDGKMRCVIKFPSTLLVIICYFRACKFSSNRKEVSTT